MRTLTLPCGTAIPALGQGTWRMGESALARDAEVAALRLGLDLGMTVIDTAEMYADGGAEDIVGEAIAGRRDEVFLISKVLPDNAAYDGVITACEGSLRRLRSGWIDLYLLHWRGATPLAETVAAFEQLVADGKIRSWGVSNFDAADLDELAQVPGGANAQLNQVLYNLARRGIEYDLLPRWSGRVPVMAYSPVEQGRLPGHAALRAIAVERGVSPAQIGLAWVLRHGTVCAIPKASSLDHVRDNRAAADLELTAAELGRLDRAFPPPAEATPLEML